jgi:integrase
LELEKSTIGSCRQSTTVAATCSVLGASRPNEGLTIRIWALLPIWGKPAGNNRCRPNVRSTEQRFHHTAITRLAEAGCSIPRIASITGHKLESCQSIIDRYLVRTSAMAREAFAQRLEYEKQAAKSPAEREQT